MKRVNLLAFTFTRGGAGRAAEKFAQLSREHYSTTCYSAEKPHYNLENCNFPNAINRKLHFSKRILSHLLLKTAKKGIPTRYSLNLFSSPIASEAIRDSQDNDSVLNVHWINNETLSLGKFTKLPTNSILTLHDEWAYLGCEHYNNYLNIQTNPFGIDWSKIQKKHKERIFTSRRDLIITCPSNWLRKKAENSSVLSQNEVRLIPNPIDTDAFKEIDIAEKERFRNRHGLDKDDILLAFGSVNPKANFYKGSNILLESLEILSQTLPQNTRKRIKLITFGDKNERRYLIHGFQANELGRLKTTEELRTVYSAADATLVPSIVESFGQVTAESLSCNTPVVAFDHSGTTDIATHEETGLLAKPFCPKSFSKYIDTIVKMGAKERQQMGQKGRNHIVKRFSKDVVSTSYRSLIEECFKRKQATI